MSQILIVELNCPRCNFTKIIQIGLDEDGVYSIPNKFCPNDMHALSREVLPNVPAQKVIQDVGTDTLGANTIDATKTLVKKNEPEQDQTAVARPVVKKEDNGKNS